MQGSFGRGMPKTIAKLWYHSLRSNQFHCSPYAVEINSMSKAVPSLDYIQFFVIDRPFTPETYRLLCLDGLCNNYSSSVLLPIAGINLLTACRSEYSLYSTAILSHKEWMCWLKECMLSKRMMKISKFASTLCVIQEEHAEYVRSMATLSAFMAGFVNIAFVQFDFTAAEIPYTVLLGFGVTNALTVSQWWLSSGAFVGKNSFPCQLPISKRSSFVGSPWWSRLIANEHWLKTSQLHIYNAEVFGSVNVRSEIMKQ